MDAESAHLFTRGWSPRLMGEFGALLGCSAIERVSLGYMPIPDALQHPMRTFPDEREAQLHYFSAQKSHALAIHALDGLAAEYGFGSTDFLLYMLKASSSIISGSATLSLIHPNMVLPGDLDFYTQHTGHNSDTLEHYLVALGYKRATPYVRNYPGSPVHSSHLFHRVDLSTGSVTQIHLIYTIENPALSITQFHSTLVMNYIAWYGLVCLYPSLTLFRKGVAFQVWATDCYRKYASRGFELKAIVHTNTIDLAAGDRTLADTSTWFLPFTTIAHLPPEQRTLLSLQGFVHWNNIPQFYSKSWVNIQDPPDSGPFSLQYNIQEDSDNSFDSDNM